MTRAGGKQKQKRIYPCADCGVLRSEEEGGKIFTVCDECWDKHWAKKNKAAPKRGTSRNMQVVSVWCR